MVGKSKRGLTLGQTPNHLPIVPILPVLPVLPIPPVLAVLP
jgi:hypothetical protein